jgi:predicted nucleic-acid-binding protein
MGSALKVYLVDTNVLLRHLLDDDLTQSPQTHRFFEGVLQGKWKARIESVVLQEMTWVMEFHYEIPRREISEVLRRLISIHGVEVPDRPVLTQALEFYEKQKVDFTDAMLASTGMRSSWEVVTFDRSDFKKLPVSWRTPE